MSVHGPVAPALPSFVTLQLTVIVSPKWAEVTDGVTEPTVRSGSDIVNVDW